jgi:hypothetical protein
MFRMRHVFAQITPDQVAEGFYVIRENTITMVYGDGNPVQLDDAPVTAKIPPGGNPDSIARVLTKRIRKALRGEKVEGFDAPLQYPADGSIV